ncbi:MAG: carbohydrate porin [Proteobacteria bacterium]|nr:carbohydrate porin [Pseudomonadota bacterium]
MQRTLKLCVIAATLLVCAHGYAQEPEPGTLHYPVNQAAPAAAVSDHSAQVAQQQSQLDKQQALIEAQSAKLAQLEKELSELKASNAKVSEALAADRETSSAQSVSGLGERFRFGSYGRVQPSMNADGMRSGRQARLVSPTPRVDEDSYVELMLGYTPYRGDDGTVVDIVSTIAFDGAELFHRTGDWKSGIAVRNLYAEVRNLWFDGFVVWAGSRMYRGDDIYLLDMWPLDNLNTYGGGLGWHGSTRTNIDIHFGTNRLKDDYQYEVVDVINERFVGEQEVVFLDRQRFISSLKAEQLWGGEEGPLFKAKLYAEIHAIGEGEYLVTQPEQLKKLPKDSGWLVGAQFGISNFLNDSYVNFFVRYAAGLAAYGEMSIPFGVATDLKAADAKHFLAGVSAGINILDYVDILLGGYVRYFADADGIEQDFDDGVEGVWDVRVTGHVGRYFRPAIELSQQLRHPNGLSPVNQKQELASLFKFSVLPGVRLGDGILGRPEIRFNYTLSILNEAAQNIFAEKDYFRTHKYAHFIGLAAEWWFNI